VIPSKPTNLPPLAEAVLAAIGDEPWAERLVLGGGVALAHYLQYRHTVDADCWWEENTTKEQKAEVIRGVEQALSQAAKKLHGDRSSVQVRTWQETTSIEVKLEGEKIFSWQIAERTRKLAPYLASPYGKVKIETIKDNLASKMTALVARGSARDFRDIHAAITSQLVSWEECWELWASKNPGLERQAGERQVALFLQAIEKRRPLQEIPRSQRDEAEALREFFHARLPRLGESPPTT
jgi:predicted nucleotidyltransferase component of viral defense system